MPEPRKIITLMHPSYFQKGFTLIELLVVIAILGILASLVMVNFGGQVEKAEIAKGKEFGSAVDHALGFWVAGKWRFNEASGTTAVDSSGNGNDGTLENGPVRRTESECGLGFGGCLEFDGVDSTKHVDAGSNDSLDDIFVRGGTITTWIKPKTVGFPAISILNKKDPNSQEGYFLFLTPEHLLRFGIGTDVPDSAGAWDTPVNSITLNQWQHIAVTFNADDIDNEPSIYINGKTQPLTPVHTKDSTIDPPTGNYASDADFVLNIGRIVWALPSFVFPSIDGLIDEVAMYDESLSTAQIKQLYAQGLPSRQESDDIAKK